MVLDPTEYVLAGTLTQFGKVEFFLHTLRVHASNATNNDSRVAHLVVIDAKPNQIRPVIDPASSTPDVVSVFRLLATEFAKWI